MKNIFKIVIIFTATLVGIYSCSDDYIDGITEVDPGPDTGAPTIEYLGQTAFNVIEPIIPVTLKFNVQDDIEITSISVAFDGTEIAYYDDFLDYRNVTVEDLVQEGVETGDHTVTIVATDNAGNTTTENFLVIKEPPYTPIFPNESLYMNFDNNFYDLISITEASSVGSPGFGAAKIGTNSYIPGTDNYITFPSQNLMSSEFSGSFWYKVNSTPTRAGIITIGPNDTDRTQGFRLFREGSATSQRIKLNVGTGTGESWNDGAVIDVAAGEWVHIAFTISNTQSIIYFDGVPVNTSTMSNGIDWTGCTSFSIGSGDPTFAYWNHLSDTSEIDDLRFFNTAISMEEVQAIVASAYEPPIDGETTYFNFEGSYIELNTGNIAAEEGSPSFAGYGHDSNNSFMSAANSYLTYPIDGVFGADSFSIVFWYQVDPDPTRAGIIVVGDDATDRFQGFRLFREGNATDQRIKLNVGIGTGESWNDGGVINATTGDWVQVAVTVSSTESKIYFDGVLQNTATYASPIDWTGCTEMVIGSGGPTFSYWNHLSDLSALDDLRIFDRVLTVNEINSL